MIGWLAARSSRERGLLGTTFLLGFGAGLWLGVFAPLLAALDQARSDRQAAAEIKAWVLAQEPPAKPGRASAEPLSPAMLEAELARHDLADRVTALSGEAGGELNLALSEATFRRVILFLEDGTESWGDYVTSARLQAAGAPGKVDLILTLSPEGEPRSP